jgi:hypothetical protein
MLSVGKGHILVNEGLLEIPDLMTPFLKTTRITDFSMRFIRSLSRDEVGEGHLSIHPFPFEMIGKTRLIMTLRARHIPMAGRPPGIHIDIHLMTKAAESGGL